MSLVHIALLQDVFVNLVEVAKENWSFGHGQASYAPPEVVDA
jgi:hypothetical protein